MAICHPHGYLREVVQGAHAMDALRYLHCLDEFEAELVVDEDAPVAASNKELVISHDRAVHLPPLDVQCFEDLGRVRTEDIDVICLVIHEQKGFADSLYVFYFGLPDPVDVGRGSIFLVQVVECPYIFEILLPGYFVLVLCELLNLLQHIYTTQV